MNIYDISEKAGVSIATVSRVLNNSSHVSEETRARVMDVIRESGYIPNAFARGLGLNTMRTVGLLCPDAGDPYQGLALSNLERLFRRKGYDCLLLCTGIHPEDRKKGVENLISRHVDGIVLMGSSFIEEEETDRAYICEAAGSVPVALLNGIYDAPGVYCAACDDYQISREAVEFLLQTGRKRILHLCHALNHSGRKKLNGYTDALKAYGLTPEEGLIRLVDREKKSISCVENMLEQLRRENVRFDAVFCSEDILAVGVLKFAREFGIRIPEDLAVIGYNNSLLCECCEPEITSVDNRLEDLCAHIAATMTAVLQGQEGISRKIFPGKLVIRNTTGASGLSEPHP